MPDPAKDQLARTDCADWAAEHALAEASGFDIEDWVRWNKKPAAPQNPPRRGGDDV